MKDEMLGYIYSLQRHTQKPSLDVMQKLMKALSNPEKTYKSIHVTGTNGKGSTCAMMESVLRAAGYKTGLYTSPHLFEFNERIRVDGVPISDEELGSLLSEVQQIAKDLRIQIKFFECTTAIAFLAFARAGIDIAIVEVGMGGEFDATNVIVPAVSVITNIGLDHMEYIGPTISDIARTKAGIIKEGVPLVTHEESRGILEIFSEKADAKHTAVICAQDVVRAIVVSRNLDGQEVDVVVVGAGSFRARLPLLGHHQIENLETALAAVRQLPEFFVSDKNIQEGIARITWEARIQVVSKQPLIIVDGAHNADSADALSEFLTQIDSLDVVVFAAKKGKDIDHFISHIFPLCKTIIVTEGSFMPEDATVLADIIRKRTGKNVIIEKNISFAITKALEITPRDGRMLVTGSLYMVPEALVTLREKGV